MTCLIGILGIVLVIVGIYGICKKDSFSWALVLLLGIFIFVGYGVTTGDVHGDFNATEQSYEYSDQHNYYQYCGY